MRLFHGGAAGRRKGDLLLPPSVTGLRTTTRTRSAVAGLGNITQRHDRVYVTGNWPGPAPEWSDDDGSIGGGVLCQVEAVGDLEPEEVLPGLDISFQVSQAPGLHLGGRLGSPPMSALPPNALRSTPPGMSKGPNALVCRATAPHTEMAGCG